MNLIKFVLNIFLFKFILLYSFNLSSNEETSYKNYFLNQLKQFEDTQIDIDLLFAEYCFFNDDPICYDDDEKETGGNSDEPSDDPNDDPNDELNIAKNKKGEIYYALTNANIRKKPNTSSEVLITVLKNEQIEVFKVSSINSGWFVIKYENITGYIYGKLISKKTQSSRKRSTTKNEQEEKQEGQTNEEWIKEQIQLCEKDYSSKDSLNSRSTYNQYCACYYDGLSDITITPEEDKYYEEHGEATEELKKKFENHDIECAEKVGLKLELSDAEWTAEQIQNCKAAYEYGNTLTRNQHDQWCSCYHGQLLDIITDEDSEYFEKYEEVSPELKDKKNNLKKSCFKEIK